MNAERYQARNVFWVSLMPVGTAKEIRGMHSVCEDPNYFKKK